MRERLLENWLDSASERTYQVPYAQILTNQGYKIIHNTRHSQIEFGKDILAVDKDGIPHAFQLKGVGGRKVSKKEIAALLSQLHELVGLKIEHPSITGKTWHVSHLVLNGELEEEASQALQLFNRGYVDLGCPEKQVHTVLRGDILEGARELADALFPQEIADIRLLLELYYADERTMLSKDRLAQLLHSCLPMLSQHPGKVKVKEFSRLTTSLGLVISIATASYARGLNYYAEIEAWIMYVAYILALAEKSAIHNIYWLGSVSIARERIYFLLSSLIEELRENPKMMVGDGLADMPFYKPRATLLLSLASVFALWTKVSKDPRPESLELLHFCREFALDNRQQVELWGEAAIPQLIIYYWYLRRVDASRAPDDFIGSLLEAVCRRNKPKSEAPLASPYYDFEHLFRLHIGLDATPIREAFLERSFMAESLLHLYTRGMWKRRLQLIWPAYTRMLSCRTIPDQNWMRYLWCIEEEATEASIWPQPTKKWPDLRSEAAECSGSEAPESLKDYIGLLLLFIIVYPHRCNSSTVRWIDTYLREKL